MSAQVAFRHHVPPEEEAGFLQAWERCKRHMVGQVPGLESVVLFRSAAEPGLYTSVSTWSDLAAWQAYWSSGIPDPEGDAAQNERWVEVCAVHAPTAPSGPTQD
ncbi:MAG: antibiotic biosynthesis monooxygenase [Planctomycetota bacterium]